MTNLTFPKLDVAQFPITQGVLATRSPTAAARFAAAIAALDQHVAANSIPNVAFNELKDPIRHAMGDTWTAHVARPFFFGRQVNAPAVDELFMGVTGDSLHLIPTYLKRVEACPVQNPAVDAMRAVLREFAALAERFVYLKDKIVKRQVKTDEQKEAEQRFVPTRATPAATKMVWQFLVDVAERNKADLVRAFDNDYKRRVAEYMSFSPEKQRKIYGRPDYREPVRAATKAGYHMSDPRTYLPDWEANLSALAEKSATELRDMFVFKVLRKLAPIVEAKGSLRAITEVARTVRVGQLTGTMYVEFADGSRFRVDNTMVRSYSSRGTPFARFPLTFHDVIMADGASMKQPSEERMHTQFAGVAYQLRTTEPDEVEPAEAPGVSG